jgi:lipopolysaccharide exporter
LKENPSKPVTSFTKDVLKMASAPLIIQITGFVVMPIIARLYTPEAFGLFSLFTAIIGPIGIFVCMGYEVAIMLPIKDKDASIMFSICILLTSVTTLLSILFVLTTSESLIEFLGANHELSTYLWLLPVVILFGGFSSSFRYWNLRKKYFGSISAANIASTSSDKSVTLGLGFAGYTTGLSLMLGTVADSIVRPIVLGITARKEIYTLVKNNIQWSKIISGIKQYRKFPMYALPTNLFGRLTSDVPVYLLIYYFSQSIVGQYALGLRLLNLPMSLIGNSVGEVYFQRETENTERNSELMEVLFKRLVLVGLLPFFLIGIIGEEIFSFMFGAIWSEAGIYAQFFSFLIFIRFITTPSNYLMILFEKQEFALFLNITTMLVTIVSIVIGGLLHNTYLSIILISLTNGIVYGIFGFGFMKYAGLSLSRIFKTINYFFLLALPIIIIIVFEKYIFHLSSIIQFSTAGFGSIIYYLFAIKQDEQLYTKLSKIKILGKFIR